MQTDSAYRAGKKRITELTPKKLHRHINRFIFMQGIHLHADILPFLIVADCSIPHPFSTGAGNSITAGKTVAYRASLTFSSIYACTCILQNIIIIHNHTSIKQLCILFYYIYKQKALIKLKKTPA